MGIGRRLREARANKKLTQQELAAIVGVTGGAIGNYENETSHPRDTVLYALINALGIDANFLFQDEMRNRPSHASYMADKYDPAAHRPLPPSAHRIGRAYAKATPPVQRTVEVALDPYMDGQDVYVDFSRSELPASAGTGVYLADESMVAARVRLDALPEGYARDPSRYFGVPVSGDSMEPAYRDGDVLIVSREPLNVGDIGVVIMDGEGYVKKIGSGALRSLNPAYADIPITESVHFCGKVVGTLCSEQME